MKKEMRWGFALLRTANGAPYLDVYAGDARSHVTVGAEAHGLAEMFANVDEGYWMLVLVPVNKSRPKHSNAEQQDMIDLVRAEMGRYSDTIEVR